MAHEEYIPVETRKKTGAVRSPDVDISRIHLNDRCPMNIEKEAGPILLENLGDVVRDRVVIAVVVGSCILIREGETSRAIRIDMSAGEPRDNDIWRKAADVKDRLCNRRRNHCRMRVAGCLEWAA